MPDTLSLKYLLGSDYAPIQPRIILSKAYEVAAVTGMGGGKTYAACVAVMRHAVRFPQSRILIGRLTYDEMLRTTKDTFFKMVEDKKLKGYFERPARWDVRERTNYARLHNGSEIFFSNLDKKLGGSKNVEYSLIIIDQAEEILFEVYRLLLLRARMSSVPPEERHVISLANDDGDGWIRDRFKTFSPPHGWPSREATRELILGSSLANPHLDSGARAQLLALPPEVQRRWVNPTLEGNRSAILPLIRVIKPVEVPAHWPRWVGIDPARSTGVTCAVAVAVNSDSIPMPAYLKDTGERIEIAPNAPYIYAEYWEEGRDVEDHVEGIQALTFPHRPQLRVMDCTSWRATLRTRRLGQLSVADLYVRSGLSVVPSTGDEWTRVMLFFASARRGLVVSEACTHLVEQAPRYKVKGQWGMTETGAHGPLKIVAKQRFHSVDAGGYALSLIPSRVTSVDLRLIEPAFIISDGLDDGSQKHWEGVRQGLPMRRGRESYVTQGFDEAEFLTEETVPVGVRLQKLEDEEY